MLPKINTIICACDLEDQTESAMELALVIANTHQAKVILLHTIEPLNAQTASMINSYITEEAMENLFKNGRSEMHIRMETILSNLAEKHAGELDGLKEVPEILVINGFPTESIQRVAKAKNADLIVMNSRTHSRLGQILIGSTANKVIHTSDIPVLVAPIK